MTRLAGMEETSDEQGRTDLQRQDDAKPYRQDTLVRAGLSMRQLRVGARQADFVFSTDAIDSYGTRIEQDWEGRLGRYRANPVVLFAHRSDEPAIGWATNTGVLDGRLIGTHNYYSKKANPLAEQLLLSLQESGFGAGSVGWFAHSVRIEREDDKELVVLYDNELFEHSLVPVPANPEALMRQHGMLRMRGLGCSPEAAVIASVLADRLDQDWAYDRAGGEMLRQVAERLAARIPPSATTCDAVLDALRTYEISASATAGERAPDSSEPGDSTPPRADQPETRMSDENTPGASAADDSDKQHQAAPTSEPEQRSAQPAAQADGNIAELRAQVAKRDETINALTMQNKALAGERDAALGKLAELERAKADAEQAKRDAEMDAEVEGLIGKRISRAEKDQFLQLRKTNEGLFKQFVEQRQPMNLESRDLIGDDPNPNTITDTGKGEAQAARIAAYANAV